jgi:hypothetical protein
MDTKIIFYSFMPLILIFCLIISDSIWDYISLHINIGLLMSMIILQFFCTITLLFNKNPKFHIIQRLCAFVSGLFWLYVMIICCKDIHSFVGIHRSVPPRICLICIFQMILYFTMEWSLFSQYPLGTSSSSEKKNQR